MAEPLTPATLASEAATDTAAEVAGDALRLLRRSLQRSRGFALLLCVCELPTARKQFIAQLGAAMPDVELITVDAADPGQDLLENLAAHVTDACPRAFMVVVADALLADPASARRFLDTLNLHRAEWPRRIPHPVAFWLPRRHLGEVTRGAPDFFDWRSDSIDFPEVADTALRALGVREWEFGVDPRFSAEEREERLRELKSRIAAVADSTDEAVVWQRLAWWDEVAELEKLRGEWYEAVRIREQEQLPVYLRLGDIRSIAVTQGRIADILQACGQLDEALRIRKREELPVYHRLSDDRAIAITWSKIADILHARGELDEALRIRQQETLPTLLRLGDVREIAVCQGKIANILHARGLLDEALRIREQEQLPAFQKLGDIREITACQSRIADILQARGQFDEALHIFQQESLPAFQRLGDISAIAAIQSRIADILQARGQLDEALRIREQEELPVYRRLGDIRAIAIAQGKIADILQSRGLLDEALRILQQESLPALQQLGIVRDIAVCQGRIADILQDRGQFDEALRIREQEEIPVHQRLGDIRELLVARAKLAINLLDRAAPGDRERAHKLLYLALADAHRLGIPEAGQIEEIIQQHKLQPEA